MFFYIEERNLYKLCPQGSHLTLVVPNIMLENLQGPEYDIHIYTCWEEIVVTGFLVTTMDTFQKRHVSSEEILSLAWPCFPRFNKESYFKWKAVNNFKGVEWGWGRGKDSKGGGVGWGWETGKDFKGGGAGGEQKSKREKDVGTRRK